MNNIFKPFLCNFTLVFFDAILIYSKAWESHIDHVDKSLQTLRDNQLFFKRSIHAFRALEVEYLGHIAIQEGVRVNPKKVVALQDCPYPKTLNISRGFLGFIGYYKKFVKNCGKIASPLTSLLRKIAFFWTKVATYVFASLKDVISTTPVLVVPDFNKTFVLECDSLSRGLRVVLMQEGFPLTFTSKQLCDLNLGKSTYEKEMMAILHTVETCHPYIIGRHF
jgi:hypothetical protein